MTNPDVQLFSIETLKDPYPVYKQLRDEAPVFFEPMLNVHVVTRYDLLREAIRDTETFSSRFDQFLGGAQQMMFDAAPGDVQERLIELNRQMIELPPTMLTLDEPEHTRYRSLVNKLFTVSRIRESAPAVQKVIDDTIAKFEGATAFDFVERCG
jgi:cytochrome P450